MRDKKALLKVLHDRLLQFRFAIVLDDCRYFSYSYEDDRGCISSFQSLCVTLKSVALWKTYCRTS